MAQPDGKGQCTPSEVVQLLDIQAYYDLLEQPYTSQRKSIIERFEREGMITRTEDSWAITNLGAVLFAKNLEEFGQLRRKATRVIVYEGRNKTSTKLDRPGTKGYAVGFSGLLDFIDGLLPNNQLIERAIREDIRMYPEPMLRELLANAMIHQDFNVDSGSIMVEIYEDRVEVSNPGKPAIDTERFIDEYNSRNASIADLMRRFGICEHKGSGIDKVVAAAEAFQLPAPDFRADHVRTSVILFAHKSFKEMDRKERVRACYQHCVLRYITNVKMTNQSLRERFQLPSKKAESVSRIIQQSLGEGRIKPEDPTVKSTRYRSYVPFRA